MNKIFLTFLIIFSTSCAYKPILSEKNYNFQIEKITFSGEKNINRVIKRKLSMIRESDNSNKKKFDVIIETLKNKKIVSNDSKGDPLKFEVNIIVFYQVELNGDILLKREIEKNHIYNNKSDKFQLEQDEKNIIDNLSNKISDDIISSIINLNDS